MLKTYSSHGNCGPETDTLCISASFLFALFNLIQTTKRH